MPARLSPAVCLTALLSCLALAAAPPVSVNGRDVNRVVEDSITVTVVGTLRTGIAAIGGETTGTTITAKGITWELDLGKDAALRESAKKLDGGKAVVRGSLERRKGVEVKERWIVTVTGLRAARDAK